MFWHCRGVCFCVFVTIKRDCTPAHCSGGPAHGRILSGALALAFFKVSALRGSVHCNIFELIQVVPICWHLIAYVLARLVFIFPVARPPSSPLPLSPLPPLAACDRVPCVTLTILRARPHMRRSYNLYC